MYPKVIVRMIPTHTIFSWVFLSFLIKNSFNFLEVLLRMIATIKANRQPAKMSPYYLMKLVEMSELSKPESFRLFCASNSF